MKITDLLVENKQEQLDELNVGKAVGAVGRGVGKAIGGVAKAAGAVAGVAGGVKRAFQQGKQAATDVIGGTEPTAGQGTAVPAPTGTQAAAAPAAQSQPAAQAAPAAEPAAAEPAAQPAAEPTAQQINKAGPAGTAPAKAVTGVAKQALQKTAQALTGQTQAKAGETLYSQVKASVDKLDKKGKQRILQLLQKSLAAPAAAPATEPAVAPAAQPAAAPAAPAAAIQAEPAAAPAPAAKGKKKAAPKPAKVSQAEIDADRNRLMGVTSDSIIRTGNSLAESLAEKVEQHKRKMFESSLAKGETSIFKK